MQRSFFAFGVLLILLAAAMLAVSSTSRSTTVRQPSADSKSALPPARRLPPAIYIVILPAGDEVQSNPSAKETVILATTNPAEVPAEPVAETQPAVRSLIGVQIDIAQTDLAGTDVRNDNCRPIESDESRPDWRACEGRLQGDLEHLDADEVVEIFHSFHATSRTSAGWARTLQPRNIGTLLLGMRNWLQREINRLAGSHYFPFPQALRQRPLTPVLSDRDYGELIDRAIGSRPAAYERTLVVQDPITVRSGRWLFDFAALSFQHIAGHLEATVNQLATSCGTLLSSTTGAGRTSTATHRSAAFLP